MPLSNVMARAGQKFKLECQLTGLPTPTVTWFHNNKPVKETPDCKVSWTKCVEPRQVLRAVLFQLHCIVSINLFYFMFIITDHLWWQCCNLGDGRGVPQECWHVHSSGQELSWGRKMFSQCVCQGGWTVAHVQVVNLSSVWHSSIYIFKVLVHLWDK